MVFLRSLVFNLLVVGLTAVYGLAVLPTLVLPRPVCLAAARVWNRLMVWLLAALVGLRYEVRGSANLPARACVLAVKHQSAFETLALPLILGDPAFVVKRELFAIPVFGWFLARLGMIAIDRKAGASALKSIVRRAKRALASGRPVVIFPEGTRVAVGTKRPYHAGVAALYALAGAPVVPVALNSGLYWRRRGFLKRPGRVVIEFLPPVTQGLDRDAFMAELESRIEGATKRLVAEASAPRTAMTAP